MDVVLNDVFLRQSKEYQTRPVKAAKYQRGMENGFMVYISGAYNGKRYDAMKFFDTETEANIYINFNPPQYISIDGKRIHVSSIEYGEPQPVIHKKLLKGQESEYVFVLEDALLSDESRDYEWFDLLDDSWVILDDDGNIRVWDKLSEEDFLGRNYVCEKSNDGNYIEVAI